MNDYSFPFAGADFLARADGSLWWPARRLLCVSDLHLGKSERMARRGGALLPPYETQETLWRLSTAIEATQPATVVCLGDSFDDLGAALSLPDDVREALSRMQAGRTWIWIEGNHDPGPVDLGGSHLDTYQADGIVFRHIATPQGTAEVSGHYHPKAGVAGAGQRPCFLVDSNRLILPAFGAYTGGLAAHHADLAALMGPKALAVLTGTKATPVPLSATLRRRGRPIR